MSTPDPRTCQRRMWYQNGMLHREDRAPDGTLLPTIEYEDGMREWYWHDVLHREDRAPGGSLLSAVIRPNGKTECWLHGVRQELARKYEKTHTPIETQEGFHFDAEWRK